MQPPAGAGVDAARDLLRVAACAGASARSSAGSRSSCPGFLVDPRAVGALPRGLAAGVGARRGRGRGSRALRRSRCTRVAARAGEPAARASPAAGSSTRRPARCRRRRSARGSSSCCSAAARSSSASAGSSASLRSALPSAVASGGLLSLAWVAFKVGALSYGGGFVIVPLMQGDAVDRYHWLTGGQFLNAVALGQVTPGPVVLTVAAVGYAAFGVGGALLAAAVAFAPSFAFVLLGGARFDRIRGDERARSFLDGAGPAAIGAILGSAIPLARALARAVAVRRPRRCGRSSARSAPRSRADAARRGGRRGRRRARRRFVTALTHQGHLCSGDARRIRRRPGGLRHHRRPREGDDVPLAVPARAARAARLPDRRRRRRRLDGRPARAARARVDRRHRRAARRGRLQAPRGALLVRLGRLRRRRDVRARREGDRGQEQPGLLPRDPAVPLRARS